MPPPRYPAIGRRSYSSKAVFFVLIQPSGPGTAWKVVLQTADRKYAMTKLEQYREAGVVVRLQEPDAYWQSSSSTWNGEPESGE